MCVYSDKIDNSFTRLTASAIGQFTNWIITVPWVIIKHMWWEYTDRCIIGFDFHLTCYCLLLVRTYIMMNVFSENDIIVYKLKMK